MSEPVGVSLLAVADAVIDSCKATCSQENAQVAAIEVMYLHTSFLAAAIAPTHPSMSSSVASASFQSLAQQYTWSHPSGCRESGWRTDRGRSPSARNDGRTRPGAQRGYLIARLVRAHHGSWTPPTPSTADEPHRAAARIQCLSTREFKQLVVLVHLRRCARRVRGLNSGRAHTSGHRPSSQCSRGSQFRQASTTTGRGSPPASSARPSAVAGSRSSGGAACAVEEYASGV